MEKELKIIHSKPISYLEYYRQLRSQLPYILTFFIRDTKIKYIDTFLGFGWQIGLPLIQIIIFFFFYGWFFASNESVLSKLLYVTSGFLIWNLFVKTIQEVGNSFIQQVMILKKNPILPIVIPVSKMLSIIIDHLPLLFIVLILAIVEQPGTIYNIIFIPIFLLFCHILILPIGLVVGLLSTYKRDILLLIPYIQMLGIWFTPIFYPVNFLPAKIRDLIYLNPIAAMIDLFRYILHIQTGISPYSGIGIGTLLLISIFCWYQYKKEESFIIDRL